MFKSNLHLKYLKKIKKLLKFKKIEIRVILPGGKIRIGRN
jgi:hypothetical protein